MVPVRLDCDMKLQFLKILAVSAVSAVALLAPESANAFRCGNKLVKEGMHEVEIVAICGEPTTKRNLGYAVRLIDYRTGRPNLPGMTLSRSPGHLLYPAEVMVSEYIYNFGPRKLMRRLIFEGNVLVEIETIGYGYIEK